MAKDNLPRAGAKILELEFEKSARMCPGTSQSFNIWRRLKQRYGIRYRTVLQAFPYDPSMR
jgi:hypothetical protein